MKFKNNLGMGKIHLEKMEFYACHGVYELEKVAPQLFRINLTVDYDPSKAGVSDHLGDTIDYQKLVDICKEVMSVPKSLLEKIALEILRKIHAGFPDITFATVTVEKPEAQLGVVLGFVSVTLTTADL
jgi:7,8-dihydroneopterin aldolase/epimerase/oxygenase